MELVPSNHDTPFDALRRVREDGTEYWSARDLMCVLGYEKWQNFEEAVARTKIALSNQKLAVTSHVTDASKKVERPQGGSTTLGDFAMSRYAAYLVAMNGDPRKPEIAAAQAYFAVKTREAETQTAAQLTGPALMAAALLEAQTTMEQTRLQVERLKPLADATVLFANVHGAVTFNEAAKELSNDERIETGQNRLIDYIEHTLRWVYRGRKKKLRAYQTAVDKGWLAEIPNSYVDRETQEPRVADPSVKVTRAGLVELHRRLTSTAKEVSA